MYNSVYKHDYVWHLAYANFSNGGYTVVSKIAINCTLDLTICHPPSYNKHRNLPLSVYLVRPKIEEHTKSEGM